MSALNYSTIDYWVFARDEVTGKTVWKTYLRTYFREFPETPFISVRLSEGLLLAFWNDGCVYLDPQTGGVVRHCRPISANRTRRKLQSAKNKIRKFSKRAWWQPK